MYEEDMDPQVIWYTHAASIKEYNLLFRIFLCCVLALICSLFSKIIARRSWKSIGFLKKTTLKVRNNKTTTMILTSTWKNYLLDHEENYRYIRNIGGLMNSFVQGDSAEGYFEKLRQNGSLVLLSVSMKYEIHATFHHDMIGNEMMGEQRLPVGLRGFNTRAFPEIIDIKKQFCLDTR